MSQMLCKNCGNEFDGNFCNQCGQKASVTRLTYKSLADNLMHGFLHVDKGFFYTIRMLIINPGKVVIDFINCKRAAYFQPFPLLIILATIYGLFESMINPVKENIEKVSDKMSEVDKPIIELVNFFISHISHNYALLNIFLIPPFALAIRIAFRKANSKKYNATEYLFAGAYLSSLYLVINIIFLPLIYFINRTEYEDSLSVIATLIYVFVTLRFLYELFKDTFWKTSRRALYALFLYGFFFVFYILIAVLIALGIVYAKEAMFH